MARLRASIVAVGIVLLAAGCAATTSPAPSRSSTTATADVSPTNTDPCAQRLHELCGVLLLYYNTHHALPPTIAALSQAPGAKDAGALVCPASAQPYVYVPAGVPVEPPPSRVVLFDPAPAHAGERRFAIVIQPPPGPAGGVLQARVIAIPETRAKVLRDAATRATGSANSPTTTTPIRP
jgi:hypothetical protein